MKNLKLSWLFLFTLFCCQKVFAQEWVITGTIVDATTKEPMVGAFISAASPNAPLKVLGTADVNGFYSVKIPAGVEELVYSYVSYENFRVKLKKGATVQNVTLTETKNQLSDEVVIRGYVRDSRKATTGSSYIVNGAPGMRGSINIRETESGESYNGLPENKFRTALQNPLSTFSIDVDAASYSNIRRFINNGTLPPQDAVRIEEMVNYFNYEYQQPKGNDPIQISTEIGNAPWNTNHKLVKIGLQGRNVPTDKLPASNLVFLIDVSGSMNSENKLPLLVSSFKMLTNQLRKEDKIAIVVYAGSAGMVLPSTPGDEKTNIKEALNKLSAGGSTAGGAGINLAYKIAADNFINGGNNRVILATDGDFNVGASSDTDMETLIEQKRKSGIFLTVLGFGMGNYKDSKMEKLADKGNGNYAYIDNITEARKVLVNEFGGTLFTIAKDVKLQIEFNPARTQAYRLIGYENRMLKAKDFNDDLKDAGELGAGHTVTALYEVIPVGVKSSFFGSVDDLKYQAVTAKTTISGNSGELMTVKLRYKDPNGSKSKLIEHAVVDSSIPFNKTSDNFRFSAAVAEFGMLLRQSEYLQESNFEQMIAIAEKAKGEDKEGYRSEFIKLAKSAKLLAKELLTIEQTTSINEKY